MLEMMVEPILRFLSSYAVQAGVAVAVGGSDELHWDSCFGLEVGMEIGQEIHDSWTGCLGV
jgi:hypothetical protein